MAAQAGMGVKPPVGGGFFAGTDEDSPSGNSPRGDSDSPNIRRTSSSVQNSAGVASSKILSNKGADQSSS